MIQYMLDTNICIYIIKKKPAKVFDKFNTLHVGQIGISAITYSELCYGISNSSRPKENESALNKFLGPIEVYEYPASAAPVYGKIRANLKSKGMIIGGNDLFIAAHAICQELVLVTNNTKEFKRIEGLRVENWT